MIIPGLGFYLGNGSSAPINEAPTDISLTNLVGSGLTVPESTSVSTAIFTISGTDPNVGDVLTFSEISDPDNKFTVSGTTVTLSAALVYPITAGAKPKAYSGNGSVNTITGIGFTPNLVIIKRRDVDLGTWAWLDTYRGATKALYSTGTAVEDSAINGLTAFGTDGWTLGNDQAYNGASSTYLGLAFKELAGFLDIVLYTGTGANRTVAHDLGVTPELMIIKSRSLAASNWLVWTTALTTNDHYLLLHSTGGETNASGATAWNSTDPTSSVFSLGTSNGGNSNTNTYVAYLFASRAGMSKIGTYTGTGTVSGPTLSCGFQPAIILTKRIDSTSDWIVWDTARDTSSPHTIYSALNSTALESTSATGGITTTSDGFQVTDSVVSNAAGGTYLYMALSTAVVGAASHTLGIRATDPAGATYDEEFTVTVGHADGAYALLAQTTGTNTTSTATALTFQTEVHDSAGMATVPTTDLIVPALYNGRYGRATGNVTIASAASTISARMLKAGANSVGLPYTDCETAGNNSVNPKGAPLLLSTGDTFTLTAQHSAGGTISTTAASTFFGFEILEHPFSGALVYRNSVQTISTADPVVDFDNELYDVGGWHDSVTNNSRLTVPSGVTRVRLTAFADIAAVSGDYSQLVMTKNGASFAGRGHALSESPANDGMNIVSAIIAVTPGDYFELQANTGDAASSNLSDAWFAIEAVPAARKGALVNRITTTDAIGAGAFEAANWNNEVYDTDGFHDNTTNPSRLTIPSGVWKVRLSANLVSGSDQWIGTFLKNGLTFSGTAQHEANGEVGNPAVSIMSCVVDVIPGDYFECSVFSTAAETITVNDGNWFQIEVLE